MFYVGQKVVCVDGSPSLPAVCGIEDRYPIEGNVYTVTKVGLVHSFDPEQLPCILVAEIKRELHEPIWAHRFRPLTDISSQTCFTKGAPRDSRKWDNRRKVRTPA